MNWSKKLTALAKTILEANNISTPELKVFPEDEAAVKKAALNKKLKPHLKMPKPKVTNTPDVIVPSTFLPYIAEQSSKLSGFAANTEGHCEFPANPWRKETFNVTAQNAIWKKDPSLAQKLQHEAHCKEYKPENDTPPLQTPSPVAIPATFTYYFNDHEIDSSISPELFEQMTKSGGASRVHDATGVKQWRCARCLGSGKPLSSPSGFVASSTVCKDCSGSGWSNLNRYQQINALDKEREDRLRGRALNPVKPPATPTKLRKIKLE